MAQKPLIIVFSTAYAPFLGGAELAVQEIARRINTPFDFVIITARLRRDLAAEDKVPEGTILRLGFGNSFDKLLLPLIGFFAARKIIKTHDHVLLWGVMVSYASIAAYFITYFYKHVPFVLTIQEGDREWEKFPSAVWWPRVLKKAHHVTAISNFLSQRVREKGYRGKITVAPNGVDEKLLEIQQTRNIVPIIFSASRLVYKNGIDILINACAKIKDATNFKIILAGDGRERTKLEVLVDNNGLRDRVQFLGDVPYEQLIDWYRKTDIFVRPSRSEGLGSAFLEAMAAGLITVGTPVGGIPDFLKDGENGFLAKPNDVADCAQVIKKTLELNEEEKSKIIKNARDMVSRHFLWKNIAHNMSDIFNGEFQNIQ